MINPFIASLALFLLLPSVAFAQGVETDLGTVANFTDYVSLIWNYGAQVLLVLAAFFVVLGAFFYVASAGNEERISQGGR
ncbi:hypothetical protein IPJ72_05930 [Candidatus Peregrinibacteria bacterium]|nr:MAG: hypothetical protein IPJ72_05930 [Candidatus Peregrinibacteria bacterium]